MTDALANHLIEIIDWHRTWIKAVDFGSFRTAIAVYDKAIVKVPSRIFRLEVRIGLYGYRRGTILSIPEEQLDRAVSDCVRQDSSMAARVNSLSLTFNDVNMIFSKASWGTLELELEA